MSPENDGITREIGFKVQKRKVCPYPVFSGGGNGGLVLYYAKRLKIIRRIIKVWRVDMAREERQIREEQATDRAGGRFYDREIFI